MGRVGQAYVGEHNLCCGTSAPRDLCSPGSPSCGLLGPPSLPPLLLAACRQEESSLLSTNQAPVLPAAPSHAPRTGESAQQPYVHPHAGGSAACPAGLAVWKKVVSSCFRAPSPVRFLAKSRAWCTTLSSVPAIYVAMYNLNWKLTGSTDDSGMTRHSDGLVSYCW